MKFRFKNIKSRVNYIKFTIDKIIIAQYINIRFIVF
jgi:hypothetical protein